MNKYSQEDLIPARSRLQEKLQNILKDKWNSIFHYETNNLHSANEAHKTKFEVVVYISGKEMGRGVDSKKRSALEKACEAVLSNSYLEEILKELVQKEE